MTWYKIQDKTIIVNVRVKPGSKQSEIVGIYDDRLKIRLQEPPVDGKANKMLIKFIAQQFKVPIKQIIILKGQKSKLKQLQITNSQINPASLLNFSSD